MGTEEVMPGDATAKRLEALEMTVEGLAGLPAQVASIDLRVQSLELQFFQLRDDVRGEFSALRREMKADSEETRAQMRTLHEEVLARIALLDGGRRTPNHHEKPERS
jgi:hypothetical protein